MSDSADFIGSVGSVDTVGSVGCPVEVSVRGPLAGWLGTGSGGTERCSREVAARLDQVLVDLGVPGRTEVRVGLVPPDAAPDPAPEDWIELRVFDERCRYPAELLARLAAAPDGRQPESVHPLLPASWSRHGGAAPEVRAAALVAAVCAEAVKLRPAVLLGPQQLARIGARYPFAASPDGPADVLGVLLDHGISMDEMASLGGVPQEARQTDPTAVVESLLSKLSARFVDVLVPEEIGPLLGEGDVGDDADLLGRVAVEMFQEHGLLTPAIRVAPPNGIPAGCFAFRLNSLLTAPYAVLGTDEVLVDTAPEDLAELGVEARPAVIPATGFPGALASAAESGRLADNGWKFWTRAEHVALCLAQELRGRAGRLVHRNKVQAQLDVLEDVLPAVVGAARARVDSGELAVLLRALAADGVPLRDLSPVLERIIDAGYAAPRPDSDRFLLLDDPVTAARTGVATGPGDPVWLEAFVRTGLRSQIAAQHSGGQNALAVCLLDTEIDRLVRQHSAADRRGREETEDRVIEAVRAGLALLPSTVRTQLLLVDDDIRPVLRRILACVLPRTGVVGYGDLPPDFNIWCVSRIQLAEREAA
ncbi:FHIPEP family type III secretion protein [Streptomyces sp. NPDC053542]|uniref:FHIPEP family type III secretion protein n=1 Tax=Streptomyces sp. NPDC053542 TaxID=3365710 RepID=UPI0037D93FFD